VVDLADKCVESGAIQRGEHVFQSLVFHDLFELREPLLGRRGHLVDGTFLFFVLVILVITIFFAVFFVIVLLVIRTAVLGICGRDSCQHHITITSTLSTHSPSMPRTMASVASKKSARPSDSAVIASAWVAKGLCMRTPTLFCSNIPMVLKNSI
jgi:hypothetical protein